MDTKRKSLYCGNIHTSIPKWFRKRKKKILKLSKRERDALKTLLEREDIILTKADKRGAVVIINVDDYVKEAN